VIDQIRVGISGPNLLGSSEGSFNVVLGDVLGTGTQIGADNLVFNPNGPLVPGIFTFSGLNVPVGAGPYYLQLAGGNIQWDFAQPLITTAGTIGSTWPCDPTIRCAANHWQSIEGVHAFDISGTATASTVPEPATSALLASGILGLAAAAPRRTGATSSRTIAGP
jgi:PEP-CTERM motif